jgi:hypothetical protein
MNLNNIIDFIVLALLLIVGVSLTYIYSVSVVITLIISILGVWYFATGVFTEGKKHEAFMKTPTHRVIVGGFMLIIGAPLLILYSIGDVRIALITFIAIIALTTLVGYYTERK